jgi:hypothetical protein
MPSDRRASPGDRVKRSWVAQNRIRAMVTDLCRKPVVQRGHESGIAGLETQPGAFWKLLESHVHASIACTQLRKPRHCLSMDSGWIGVVALCEGGGLLVQVRTDQGHLRRIPVSGDDILSPAILQRRKYMDAAGQVEGHDFGTQMLRMSRHMPRILSNGGRDIQQCRKGYELGIHPEASLIKSEKAVATEFGGARD